HDSKFYRQSLLSSRPLPPPALCECRHRSLACRRVAVRRPTVFVVAKGQRPHPRRPDWRGVYLEDAADNITVGQHIVIVITPLTGRSARRGTLEDQIVLVHFTEPTCGASCVDGPRLAKDHLACSAEVAWRHLSALLVHSAGTPGPDGVRLLSPHPSTAFHVPVILRPYLACHGSTAVPLSHR